MMTVRYETARIQSTWGREGELARLCLAAQASAYTTGGSELFEAVRNLTNDELRVNLDVWAHFEHQYDHDIAAFVEMIRRGLPEQLRDQWHRGRTSSDLVDTALGLALKDSAKDITDAKQRLARVLARRACEHQLTHVMGRTHGQAAEPTSVGRKFAILAESIDAWYTNGAAIGKMSGPVGVDARPLPNKMLRALGLEELPSTQIVPRWYLADFVLSLVPLSIQVSTLATEIRLGAQTGIGWCREVSPSARARGSSSMPHKRNPIRSERAVGLCKVIRHNAYAVADSAAELWNERDISHSSVERTALVDCIQLLHFVLTDMTGVVDRLEVDEEAASRYTDQPTGLGAVEALLGTGLPYSVAYKVVRDEGPAAAAEFANADGRGRPYDPAVEPYLWGKVADLAG